MKVRILSGNQTGVVVDMPKLEAEANIATGYAEAVEDEKAEAPVVKAKPEEAARLGKKLTPAELKRQAREEDENDDRL